MDTLREIFTKLYAYVLLFEQAVACDLVQPSYEQVLSDISGLVKQQREAARRLSPETNFQEALFAFAAWADERILTHPSWKHHNEWMAYPLQLEHFHSRNAGEEFFERLDRLGPEQKEAREIYYLSLGLGFRGKYFLGLEDELRLAQIRHEQFRRLALPVEDMYTIDRLTPQPYAIASPAGTPIRRPFVMALLKAGLVLLLAIPIAFFLMTKPPTPGTPPETMPSKSAIILQHLAACCLECAKVSVHTIDEKTGSVRLGGRIASESQRTDILKVVQSSGGIAEVSDTMRLVPRPFCEALEILEPFGEYAAAQQVGLAMRLSKAGDTPVYSLGEHLAVEVRTPTAFASYVYVDYYSADGNVVHLLPSALEEQKNLFGPKSVIKTGHLDGATHLQITAPLGLELLTVMASRTPLFATPRLKSEPAELYLKVLRQRLQQASLSDVATTWSFIMTRDQS